MRRSRSDPLLNRTLRQAHDDVSLLQESRRGCSYNDVIKADLDHGLSSLKAAQIERLDGLEISNQSWRFSVYTN